MTVDFAEVRKVPIAAALAMYKVETRKRSNTELVCNCPLPSHEKSSHKQMTFAVSLEKGKWYCHSSNCREAGNHPKGGDVIDLICRLDNTTALEAAKKLSGLFCVGGKVETQKPIVADNEATGNKPLAWKFEHLDPDHPFIRERGLSLETVMEFGVGVQTGKGSMSNRVCFPFFEGGALVGYAGRTVLPVSEENPKWRLPSGLHRSFVYGLEKCDPSKPLILCESPWACLWFFQHHQQAAALIGTTMTPEQETCLAPFTNIVVAMDNDQPGREAAEKLAERLKANHKVSKAFLKE